MRSSAGLSFRNRGPELPVACAFLPAHPASDPDLDWHGEARRVQGDQPALSAPALPGQLGLAPGHAAFRVKAESAQRERWPGGCGPCPWLPAPGGHTQASLCWDGTLKATSLVLPSGIFKDSGSWTSGFPTISFQPGATGRGSLSPPATQSREAPAPRAPPCPRGSSPSLLRACPGSAEGHFCQKPFLPGATPANGTAGYFLRSAVRAGWTGFHARLCGHYTLYSDTPF